MDDTKQFETDGVHEIERMGADDALAASTREWMDRATQHKYSYHFSWMGVPIIQFPQDIMAMQEILWRVRPDLVIETGIARGGSILFYAAMMEMMGIEGQVVGIDIDVRAHNRARIEDHPMAGRIEMIEASSIAPDTARRVAAVAQGATTVLVALDSNHTHDHVTKELELYAPLVTPGSYLVVFDTLVEFQANARYPNRPWAVGNNPHTAVMAFLEKTDRFEIDKRIANKLQISVAPDGYLKCRK